LRRRVDGKAHVHAHHDIVPVDQRAVPVREQAGCVADDGDRLAVEGCKQRAQVAA
jgi:hypothetical protein